MLITICSIVSALAGATIGYAIKSYLVYKADEELKAIFNRVDVSDEDQDDYVCFLDNGIFEVPVLPKAGEYTLLKKGDTTEWILVRPLKEKDGRHCELRKVDILYDKLNKVQKQKKHLTVVK